MYSTLRLDPNKKTLKDIDYERIRTACLQCRVRKLKCTGERTGCSRCRAQHFQCQYLQTSKRGRSLVDSRGDPKFDFDDPAPTDTAITIGQARSRTVEIENENPLPIMEVQQPRPLPTLQEQSMSSATLSDESTFSDANMLDASEAAQGVDGEDASLGTVEGLMWNLGSYGRHAGRTRFGGPSTLMNTCGPLDKHGDLTPADRDLEVESVVDLDPLSCLSFDLTDTSHADWPSAATPIPSTSTLPPTTAPARSKDLMWRDSSETNSSAPACHCQPEAFSLLQSITHHESRDLYKSIPATMELCKQTITRFDRLLNCSRCRGSCSFLMLLILLSLGLLRAYEQILSLLRTPNSKQPSFSPSRSRQSSTTSTVGGTDGLPHDRFSSVLTMYSSGSGNVEYAFDAEEELLVLKSLVQLQLSRLREILREIQEKLDQRQCGAHISMAKAARARIDQHLRSRAD